MTDSPNQLITKVFVEQPLASPGSAKYYLTNISDFWLLVLTNSSEKYYYIISRTNSFDFYFWLLILAENSDWQF